jgi:hypothetical protein
LIIYNTNDGIRFVTPEALPAALFAEITHLVSFTIFVVIETTAVFPGANLTDLFPPVLKLIEMDCADPLRFVTRTLTTHSPFELAVTLPGALTEIPPDDFVSSVACAFAFVCRQTINPSTSNSYIFSPFVTGTTPSTAL